MATVDLSYVQFWQPPLNPTYSKKRTASSHTRKNGRSGPTTSSRDQPASPDSKADEILRHDKQSKSAAALARHQGRDSAIQHEDDAVRAQGRNNDPANRNDEADGDLPSIDELLTFSSNGISTVHQNSEDTPQHLEGPALNTSESRLDPNPRSDNGVGNSQDTQERPVILEDDESDTPEPVPEAAAVSVSVDAGADPASELSKGPWWDVEDRCYVDDDLCPIPPLEQEGLASMPALAQPHSHHNPPGSSQDQVSQYGDGMGSAPDEPAPPTLPQPLGESGGGGSQNASELERDMQIAFEEQEKPSSVPAPGFQRPRRPSAEPPNPQTEQEHDRGGTSCGRSEELGRGPPLRSQDWREDDGGDSGEPEERGEKRQHLDETEIRHSDIHHPEASDCSRDASDEDEEDPRPAKRRRPSPTDNALTPPNGPAPVDNDDHHPSRTSRSPSVTLESAPVAEYQEWPFRGFLKRTKIRNKTIYNLEFQLPHVSKHLHSEALGMRSDKETSAEAATPHDASAYSKMHAAAIRPRIKRVRWTPEEDATILKMREDDGCSWEEIHAALPSRTLGTIQVHYSMKLKK